MSIFELPRRADLWLSGYIASQIRRRHRTASPTHILFAIADHYEPDNGAPAAGVATERVRRWLDEYPRLCAGLCDFDGRPPQHTFFYPAETYQPAHLDLLSELCDRGFGEVEIHLHHDDDTAESLRATLNQFRDDLSRRHGLLCRDETGVVRYGFVHGNWALDNSRKDGKFCGVNNELDILIETGCYADFTMPAAPDSSQSRIVNAIYYAKDDPDHPRSHDFGKRVRVGQPPPDGALLMIQGPLSVALARNNPFRVILENGALDSSVGHLPTRLRFERWLRTGVSVIGREEWVIVKIFTHGAPEKNAAVLLGATMRRFHEDILGAFNDGTRYALHYVTARELANIVLAAASGEGGNPGDYRDYRYRRQKSAS